ncbi:MAG: ribosome maturation factor RimP [Sphingomonadales bacterium]
MTAQTEQLWTIMEPAAEALGYRLVRVSFGGGQRAVLQVMAERPDGSFTIDDCEALSRDLSAVLDVEDPIAQEYVLEVSSPGIDRHLVRLEDFEKFVGFEAKVTAKAQIDGRRRFTGRITDVQDDGMVQIDCAEGTFPIPFDGIEKAKLILTDALIKAHQEKMAQA